MDITEKQLDTPICELMKGTTNTETHREFIRNSENEFGMDEADLSTMNDEKLNDYINFLDYLWGK